MTAPRPDDARIAALDAYLEDRLARGYRVETRSRTQAVIQHRPRGLFLFAWLRPELGRRREVVSVDEHGHVSSVAAQPLRR
jgi:hypothetical protein